MRIDKLLWFLRLARTRSAAQQLVGESHIRLNSKRVERSAQNIAVGDVLVLPRAQAVLVIEVLAIPTRRGPACETQSCYRVLDERAANPIAASKASQSEGIPRP
jgi:ribosome-associated heat shock protein Hsp15